MPELLAELEDAVKWVIAHPDSWEDKELQLLAKWFIHRIVEHKAAQPPPPPPPVTS